MAIGIAVVALRLIDSVASRFSDRFSDRRLLAQQTNTILRFIIYMVTIVVAINSVITLEQKEFETDVTIRVKQAFQERGIMPPSVIYSPAHEIDESRAIA